VSAPLVGVLHAPGTNRDGEAARAVTLAGGEARIVHLDESLDPFAALIVPGGFSYGDALGAGGRLALEIGEALAAYAATGRVVLGICNGFQTLAKAGLFSPPPHPRRITLTHNASNRFECRWVTLAVEPDNPAGLAPCIVACPVAHGEGRVVRFETAAVETARAELPDGIRALFRYVRPDGTPAAGAHPFNPNGSFADLAGVCNAAGNVWGLMPHPEDHVVAAQDPFRRPGRSGLVLFEALVDRARAH